MGVHMTSDPVSLEEREQQFQQGDSVSDATEQFLSEDIYMISNGYQLDRKHVG